MTGSADGTAKLINLHSGNILGSFENHTDAVETVGFSDHLNLAATGSLDGRLNIWDVQTMQLRTSCEHKGPIIKLAWHKNQPWITSCSADRSVQVWDARTGQNLKIWLGHQDAVLSFAMTNDGLTKVPVEERQSWITKTKATIKVDEGGHYAHMEDAPTVARDVCPWILAQDIGEVARL
ncbi:hypothetical protein BGZ82_002725 [Podila clonocystis]|nr:hypothetical protein BGZ82_002725 [Podila clonocystis]